MNELLRSQIRYRGDLSKMASAEQPMVSDTTISLPRALHNVLKDLVRLD